MKQYLTAAEVAETVGVSTTKAYGLIREMNAELKQLKKNLEDTYNG